MNRNKNISQQDMLEALVGFVTGKELSSYSPEEQEEVIEEVVTLIYGYLTSYMEENYTKKDVIRIKKAMLDGDTNILKKFPETTKAFQQSLLKMIENLS